MKAGWRDAIPTPLCQGRRRSHRHPDVMLDQIAQHRADGSKAFEQIEHLTNRALRLFVRVQHDIARGAAHIPHRHRLAEFAPPSLGAPPFQHPRLEDVQFCFRHRSFHRLRKKPETNAMRAIL
jgi:hypothetical protein